MVIFQATTTNPLDQRDLFAVQRGSLEAVVTIMVISISTATA